MVIVCSVYSIPGEVSGIIFVILTNHFKLGRGEGNYIIRSILRKRTLLLVFIMLAKHVTQVFFFYKSLGKKLLKLSHSLKITKKYSKFTKQSFGKLFFLFFCKDNSFQGFKCNEFVLLTYIHTYFRV